MIGFFGKGYRVETIADGDPIGWAWLDRSEHTLRFMATDPESDPKWFAGDRWDDPDIKWELTAGMETLGLWPWLDENSSIWSVVSDIPLGFTSYSGMFYNCYDIGFQPVAGQYGPTVFDLKNVDFSSAEDLSAMFYFCDNLKSVDFSGADLSSVKNMSYMFYGCGDLQSFDFTKFDMSSVENFDHMFVNCKSLETIILDENFRTGNYGIAGYWTNPDYQGGKAVSWSEIGFHFVPEMAGTWTRINTAAYAVYYEGGLLRFQSDLTPFDGREIVRSSEILADAGIGDYGGYSYHPYEWDFQNYIRELSVPTSFFVTSIDIAVPISLYSYAGMFSGFENVRSITGLENLDVISVSDISSMFSDCTRLKSLDFSGWMEFSSLLTDANVSDFLSGCDNLYLLTFGSGFFPSALDDYFYEKAVSGRDPNEVWEKDGLSLSLKELFKTFKPEYAGTWTIGVDGYAVLYVNGMLRFQETSESVDGSGITEFWPLLADNFGMDILEGPGGPDVSYDSEMHQSTFHLSWPWNDYRDEIESISFDIDVNVVARDGRFFGSDEREGFYRFTVFGMFANCRNLKTVEHFERLHTPDCGIISRMFFNCPNLSSDFDVSGLTGHSIELLEYISADTSYMFWNTDVSSVTVGTDFKLDTTTLYGTWRHETDGEVYRNSEFPSVVDAVGTWTRVSAEPRLELGQMPQDHFVYYMYGGVDGFLQVEKTGDLHITKFVEGADAADTEFHFKLRVLNANFKDVWLAASGDGTRLYTGYLNTFGSDLEASYNTSDDRVENSPAVHFVNNVCEFVLKDRQTLDILNIPLDPLMYELSEQEADSGEWVSSTEYRIYNAKNSPGTPGYLYGGESHYIIVTNRGPVSAKVGKSVPDDADDTEFSFRLERVTEIDKGQYAASGNKITADNFEQIVKASAPANAVKYETYNTATSEKQGDTLETSQDGVFTLKAGQYADLHLNPNSLWLVSESDIPAGYLFSEMSEKGGTDKMSRISENLMLIDYGIAPETESKTYTVILNDPYGGTISSDEWTAAPEGGSWSKEGIAEGEHVSLPTPEYEYTFLGWKNEEADRALYTDAIDISEFLDANRDHRIVLTAQYNFPDVEYAVSVYGICQDLTEDESYAGLTFGPATGQNYIDAYKSHVPSGNTAKNNAHRCIHTDSWETIIEWASKDPYVYEQCVSNGCTRSVGLRLSEKLRSDMRYPGMIGDGASILYESLNENYLKWNNIDDTTGGWPASRMRTTLNGKESCISDTDEERAGTDLLSENEALISAFPEILRNAIVPKAVKSDTAYGNEDAENVKTTYDKLWLFSGAEIYMPGSSNTDVIRNNEGLSGSTKYYLRAQNMNITTENYSGNTGYNESGSAGYWWLRSLYRNSSHNVYRVYYSGDWSNYGAGSARNGAAPGFCLGKVQ